MYKTAYNSSASPVVVDELGHVIAGHDWGTVETTDGVASAALAGGTLTVVERPGRNASMDPGAVAAFDRTAEVSGRSDAFGNLERDDLFNLAVDAGLQDPDDDTPYKAELVARLAYAIDVDVPEKPKAAGKQPAEKTEES